ncbi:TPM domain-containing protein, partial [Pseudonocardia sp. KRD291]|uniref:TPM domain-containing protein n=1 Tax=Pseudonocardia sp. KRD291 TaxID=2792007 RepID=UPI001C49FA20
MRRLSTLVAAAVVLLLSGAGVAVAEPPPRLADRVTDRAGVLYPSGRAAVTAAIDDLRTSEGIDLFVVYVRSFDDLDGPTWADRAAQRSQLGDADALLAVATEDRAYGTSFSQSFTVPESATDSIESDDVEPRLSANDWAGAAVAMANGLRDGGSSSGGGAGGGLATGAAVVGGLVVVGGGAYLVSRRRRDRAAAPSAPAPAGPGPDDEFAGVTTEDLGFRGSQALLEIDDAVRTSEQELAAARAHFGDEAVAGFAAALELSRADMLRGFTLQQQLDDEVPEDEPTRRSMLAEIVHACRDADERLDAQVAEFDALRSLEAGAPEYLAGLGTSLAAVDARVAQVDATLASLRTRYAAAALAPVADNVGRSRELLAAAAQELVAARGELARTDPGQEPDPGTAGSGARSATPTGAATADAAPTGPATGRSAAVVSGRAAEEAITQAGTLLDGVGRLEADLAGAGEKIAAARAETEQDLAEARAILATGDPGGLAALVARAEAALASADEGLRATPPDPLAALRLVDDADAALDEGLAQAKDAQERTRRITATLAQTLLTARSAVGAADDFITTRRGAVGTDARTRLAEARRHLQQAEAGGDPSAALTEAQAADAMARAALQLAQS